MVLARPDLVTAKGLLAIPHGLAIIATVFRLWDRQRLRRLWWDDLWAFIALIFDIPHMIVFFLRPASGSGSSTMPINSRIAIYWISLVMFPSVLWAARISISVSILRLCPPGSIWRRVSYFTSVLFGFLWAGLLIYRVWQCGHDSAWHNNPGVQCFLPRSIGVMTLVTDIVADILLIAIPMIMIYSYQMAKSLRRLFMSVFAASILTSLASIVYVTFLFGARGWGPGLGLIVAITSHLEAAVSLLVCNILVIVTFFYRISHHGEDLETIAEVTTQDITRVPGASHAAPEKDGSMRKDSTSDVDIESK
ncbi:hypothetical protein ONZ45_g7276 [Pleurotus djamor]|nr:hypothetical protein ONZ45_g7276 [Pleurotus djamor]